MSVNIDTRPLGERQEAPLEKQTEAYETLQGVSEREMDAKSHTSTSLLPEELSFLNSPHCNPDLLDPKVCAQGCIRLKPPKDYSGQRRRCGRFPSCVGWVVNSWTVQTLVLLVILFDFIMTIIGFAKVVPDDHDTFKLADWLTIIVLTVDVLGRWFAEGMPFLKKCMNIFELCLVPITILEIFLLRHLNVPVQLLRVLRPIFRGIRLIRVLARAASTTSRYIAELRRQVSGDRIRFVQDGFDLDLAYITPQIVAMSVPAVGHEAWLRNPAKDVARFLNERHGNRYLLLNVTPDVRYDTSLFFNRCAQFAIMKDSVPNLEALMDLCRILDGFLQSDPDNVLAVHSQNGQGRVSMIIVALLIYRGTHRSVPAALAFFETARINAGKCGMASAQTVDCASQRRFLDYFSSMCGKQTSNRPLGLHRQVKLHTITVHGMTGIHQVDVCCYSHPGATLQQQRNVMLGKKKTGLNRSRSALNLDAGERDIEEPALKLGGASGTAFARARGNAKRAVEESTFDTGPAGCLPLRGRPIFSSLPGSAISSKVTARVASAASDDGIRPGAWELDGIELTGEIRIEFHRRKKTTEQMAQIGDDFQDSSKEGDNFSGILAPGPNSKDEVAQTSLLAACWLHTAFLEQDEPSITNRRKLPTQLTVYLDRLAIDKGAFAPALRSQSAGLRVQLDFEVEQRNANETSLEDHEIRFKLASAAQVSEPETLNWMNWVLAKIWPSFQQAFKTLVEGLVPQIAESLPGPLKDVSLAAFSLGNGHPQLGPITASSRIHEGMEVQLDIVLNYETDTNVILNISIASFAICHLKIHGVLSIKFKPIVQELPVLTAMQMLFLNPPTIDLRFARNLEVANTSLIRRHIFGAINKGLADVMVLPNIMNINWADPSDLGETAVTFRNVFPCGVLRLCIMEGKNLAQESTMFRTLPDTYAVVNLGSQAVRTTTIHQSSNPVWGQVYDLLLYDERQTLDVSVFSQEIAGSTNIGGALELQVAEIILSGEDGKWVGLLPHRMTAQGQVLLKATVFDLHANPEMVEAYIGDASELVSKPLLPTSGPRLQLRQVSRSNVSPSISPMDDMDDPIFDMKETEVADGYNITGQMTTMAPADDSHREAGCVVLLTCDILGGALSSDFATPSDVLIEVTFGKARQRQPCSEASENVPDGVSDKTQKSIQRLAALSLTADVIAEALGESAELVQRIMRKHGWNLECTQKICVLVHRSDLRSEKEVTIKALTNKGKLVAMGRVEFSGLLHTTNARRSLVLACEDELGSKTLDLDVELRLYALKEQSLQSGDHV